MLLLLLQMLQALLPCLSQPRPLQLLLKKKYSVVPRPHSRGYTAHRGAEAKETRALVQASVLCALIQRPELSFKPESSVLSFKPESSVLDWSSPQLRS